MFRKLHDFIPKSYLFLRKYNFTFFKKDLSAGITVGLITLPLVLAYAMASGVAPERGVYCAVVAGFLISLLGGSRYQIGGPTGAFIVVIYSIVQRHGYDGLVMATVLAAFMLIAMGIFRFGTLIKFIPFPLITGFTTGLALVIFSSQMKNFLGLEIDRVPADFIEKWHIYFQNMHTWQPTTFAVGGLTLLSIIVTRRYFPKLPWGILSIVLATAICWGFDLDTATITSRFGELPRTLPAPTFDFNYAKIREVLPDSITIALLAGIEGLLSAVIADNMTGGRHKANCELIAQGIGNLGSMIFGGIPATGAVARTAANVKTGAQTPVAGMIHAVVLVLCMFFFAPLAGLIPLAALSAVLIVIAWNMSEAHHVRYLLKAPVGDIMILLTAFTLTVLVDLTVAVEVGMILAAFLFMKRMTDTTQVMPVHSSEEDVKIFEVRGPFFFGVADRLKDVFQHLDAAPKVFILRMKHVPILDATGLHAIKEFNKRCLQEKTKLVLSEVQAEPTELLKKFGLGELIS